MKSATLATAWGCFLAIACNVCVAQNAFNPQTDPGVVADEQPVQRTPDNLDHFVECLMGNNFKSPRFYRVCFALFWGGDADVPVASEQPTNAPARLRSTVDCLAMALHNVGGCSDSFLVPDPQNQEVDPVDFTVCLGAAVMRFMQCTGVREPGASPTLRANTKNGVELLLAVGEEAVAQPDGQDSLLQAFVGGGGDGSTVGADACFDKCVDNYRSNKRKCEKTFPNSPDDKKLCIDKARQRFSDCVDACPVSGGTPR